VADQSWALAVAAVLASLDRGAQAADDPADFLGLGEEAIERGLV
jgi:hypothetical protein